MQGLNERVYIWIAEGLSGVVALAVVVLLPEGAPGRWRPLKTADVPCQATAAGALIQAGSQVAHVWGCQKPPAHRDLPE